MVVDMFGFTAMVTSWFWTRVVVLPTITYYLWTWAEFKSPEFAMYTLPCLRMSAILLGFLCCLHVYWLILMLNMLRAMIVTGEREDLQNKAVGNTNDAKVGIK